MKLKEIFQKPVDRPIEGVIKADDEAGLLQEVEEYVLTNEVEQHLEEFLGAYNDYQGANGVWISGFFGSGKSHLLKMLALLMENREVEGNRTLDLFLPKCSDNQILRADLKKAVNIPSQSILFNIDQKADVISKTQIDALLAVFVKVFNETRGYYGKQGHIAQFEKDLDERGLYEKFKTAFQQTAGKDWNQGREQTILEKKNIARAYAQVSGESEEHSMGIIEQYRSQYKVSIEDFAEQVKAYVDKQGPRFRLNFFVDEVGQFIAENIKLMTNLQTIAESLATKCRGRAWIIVTSQNDMSSLLGEFSRQQTHDFSKIIDRFRTRMPLTSTNVAEVVQKRLLAKNEHGTELISDLYDQQSNNLGTLFSFTDGSRAYKPCSDREDFIRSYPFVPYQFDLFQSSIENLSRHNAFEGKYSSVGERSMLGVFRQVAIEISDYQIGQLASFNLMFEGIQSALKAQIQKAVLAADRQLEDKFAAKLLKALFLVKYVREFKASLHNLCILMLDSFEKDHGNLKNDVQKALNLLEQQTYIQRNGDVYEFLTDEEKDVEEEIKSTEVERADLMAELEKIIFDHIIKTKKINYDNNQDYPFSRKMDDRLRGREHELAIHIITPFNEQAENEFIIKARTTGRDELLVLMPTDDRFVRDLLMFKRTEKYIRQNISITQQDGIKKVLENKANYNNERYRELQSQAKKNLGKAKLIVSGKDLEIRGEDPQARIHKGFYELIARAYPNLRMLRGIDYRENHIGRILRERKNTMEGMDIIPLGEAEQEIMAFIRTNSRNGVRTTLKTLIENFSRKPYGWYYAAILCLLANLLSKGRLEAKVDSNILEFDELEKSLRNTQAHANIILEPQVEFTGSQVRRLKDFYKDFFDSQPSSGESRALAKETGHKFKELKNQLTALNDQTTHYPFLSALKPVIEKVDKAADKPYTWYLTDLPDMMDDLLDLKEDVIDPIRSFMNGPQKSIYDQAMDFIHEQKPNFDYIQDEGPSQLISLLHDPNCYKGSRMNQVKTQLESFREKVRAQINVELLSALEKLELLKNKIILSNDYKALPEDKKNIILKEFEDILASLKNHEIIAVIRDSLRRFEEIRYRKLLELLDTVSEAYPSRDDKEATDQVKEIPIQSLSSIPIKFNKPWLADQDDVEQYLTSMRDALLEEIKKGKKIQI